jgi:hypothetical protein
MLTAYRQAGTVRGAADVLGISTATLFRFIATLNLYDEWRNVGEWIQVRRFYGYGRPIPRR